MALGFEESCLLEASLENATVDFVGIRRAESAARSRQNFSTGASPSLGGPSRLAAPIAQFTLTTNRPMLHLHAPRRCRNGELHRDHSPSARCCHALLRRSTMQEGVR